MDGKTLFPHAGFKKETLPDAGKASEECVFKLGAETLWGRNQGRVMGKKRGTEAIFSIRTRNMAI